MARPIVLSNGELHVGLNNFNMVHDFYYPYVGHENHAAAGGLRHRIGVWVDGAFSWLDDGSWKFRSDYPHGSLIGHTKAFSDTLSLALEFDDCVDASQSAFLRNIHIINCANTQRTIKLFMHQVFVIGGSAATDTSQYLPDTPGIVHYKGHRVFLASGQHRSGAMFDQYTIGVYDAKAHKGAFCDAEDGYLGKNNVEYGSVDSVLGFDVLLKPHDSTRIHYWVAAGKSMREALVIHDRIKNDGLLHRMLLTNEWWRQWLVPADTCIASLPRKHKKSFTKSLLILRSHIDKRGAVIASTDTTRLKYWRDTYTYCWPRDGAFVIWPLIRLGFQDEPVQFFNFCKRALHPDGYLMQKYQADGAPGSGWHPYIHDNGVVAPPIQEDETAIVIFMLLQYFHRHDDPRALRDYYDTLVRPMANFLSSYIDPDTKLPKPSYDLWEQMFITTTYSTAAVFAGLQSAVHLAEKLGENSDAIRWGSVAYDLQRASHTLLYNSDKGFFYLGVSNGKDGLRYYDTIDVASFYGAFMFGLFDVNSNEVEQSFNTVSTLFSLGQHNRGVPRYENDKYHTVDPSGLGNPWFITTLWVAQYHMEMNNYDEAAEYIQWTQDRMLGSGVLAEQVNPHTNEHVSVSPLAWSQAEFINTMLDFVVRPSAAEESASV